MIDWNVWPQTQRMIQLGGFASAVVHRFRFPNDLNTLVQHQQEEILEKEKSRVQMRKWRVTSYTARFQKRLWHFRGLRYNCEVQQCPTAAQRQIPAYSDDPRRALSDTQQSSALGRTLLCSLNAFYKRGLERILRRTTKLKTTGYKIKMDLFKPDMLLRRDKPRQADKIQPEGSLLLPTSSRKNSEFSSSKFNNSSFNLCLKLMVINVAANVLSNTEKETTNHFLESHVLLLHTLLLPAHFPHRKAPHRSVRHNVFTVLKQLPD